MANQWDLLEFQNNGYRGGYGCPDRAYGVAMLSYAIVDFARFGVKRHRQRCRKGRDWERINTGVSRTKIAPVYQELHDHIGFLYSQRFGLICDVLNLDLEAVQSFFLKLLAGPPV